MSSHEVFSIRSCSLLASVGMALLLGAAEVLAANGDCSQPVSSGTDPSASDCLFILKVAVGSEVCEVDCVCAPKGTLPTTASDALTCLRSAVGQTIELDCPCDTTTTTTLPGSAHIQDVQDGSIPPAEVATLEHVFMTGLVVSGQGHRTFVLQEPEGVTTAAHDYPEYAGMRGFASSQTVSSLPDLTLTTVGDCVSLTGLVTEFQGATQVSNLTAFERIDEPATCGSFPLPFVVALADIATDTDAVTAGDQAGAKTEIYEGVLLRVGSVEVQSVEASGDFRVKTTGGGTATLLVSRLLFAFPPVSIGTTYASITGVLTEAQPSPGVMNYRLVPRSSGDFVE
jgi:hypothetical protein